MASSGASRSVSPHGTLLLFTHLLIFLLPNSAAQSVRNGSEVDLLALLFFKGGITNDPRGVLSSWNSSVGFCGWRGVTCGTALPPRVVSLNLSYAGLSGQLSPSIANLTSLGRLDLSNNSFFGEIPEELCTLHRLQFMTLSGNNLEGIIPRSVGINRSLRYVDLSKNRLVGTVPNFHKMSALQILDLSINNLTGSIPSSLGNVSSLTEILLYSNSLSGSVPETVQLGLSMSGNRLEGLIPSSLANASNLLFIDLGINSLTGPVPSLGSLSDLEQLILEINSLEAQVWKILTHLVNCTKLEMLDLGGNSLTGSVPRLVGNLSTNLQQLNLGKNQIVGTIPVEIFNLPNLQLLAMDQNLLTGVIPPSVGNLHKLFVLSLSGNKFKGQIPSTIGNLSGLNELYLDSNGFSGNIPAGLGNFKQLDMLNLSFNSLQGHIPSELINSTSLVGLDLSNNNLTGSMPLHIGALIQLLRLDISFNNLSGQVPFSLGRCVQLSSLILRSNMLNGSIPQSFSNLKSIGEIDLSNNNLGGQIPEFFVNMKYLQQLDLSTNLLEGPIPTGGIFQNHSAVILDGNAGLCASATTNLFKFPVCTTASAVESKTNAHLFVKVIPPVAIALISFIFFMATLLKGRQEEAGPCYNATMKKVSYGGIVKATNWFSPVNKISSSRTGSIYIGRFEFETDLVAIKLFHLEENGARNSFLTECEVLRNTRHRNLVKAVTVCSTVDLENNEFKAIVFDFMANGSLDMWLHPKLHQNFPKRVLSFRQRLRIAMDVAMALDYMHNQLTPPLIHCDLKPGNVLLDYDMTARVGDFGSSRFLSSSPGSPEDLVGVEGTIGYIAPEYCMAYKISTGCDVYGFGILLLEMLTGRRPTDAMFTDGLSLHRLVSSAFPGGLGEVLDPHMVHEQQHECDKVLEQRYIVPLVEVGLLCSMESPKD